MNNWLTLWRERWHVHIEPWLPWADDALDTVGQWLAEMPAVVWIGVVLWLAMRWADQIQQRGGLRTTAFAGCGLLVAGLTYLSSDAERPHALAVQAQWLFDLALGWVLFCVGQRIDMRWLLRNRALAATAVLEFGLTALAACLVLAWLGVAWPVAMIAGVLIAHSSPVVLASFMAGWKPDGQISARALHLGGINTLLSAVCLPLLLVMLQAWQQGAASSGSLPDALAHSMPFVPRSGWDLAQPLLLLILSLLVGGSLGRLLARPDQTALRSGSEANGSRLVSESMSLVAVACVCAGLAQWWGAPAWAAGLALGLGLRSPQGAAWRDGQGLPMALTELSQMLLFALSGLTLVALWLQSTERFISVSTGLGMMIPLVLVIVVLRLITKVSVCTLTARWAGLRTRQGMALGLAMQPLSMTGLALLWLAWPILVRSDVLIAWSLVSALMISDGLAPILLRLLLRRSGEVLPEPRVVLPTGRIDQRVKARDPLGLPSPLPKRS